MKTLSFEDIQNQAQLLDVQVQIQVKGGIFLHSNQAYFEFESGLAP